MRTRFFTLPRRWAVDMAATFCVGLGCAYPLALAFGLIADPVRCAMICAAAALVYLLADCMPRLRALAWPVILAAMAAVVWRYAGQIDAIRAALTLAMSGQPLALAAYSVPAVLLLCLLFTSLGAALARSDAGFFPLALLLVGVLLAISFLGPQVSPMALTPLLVALALAGRAPGVRPSRALITAALILAGTLALSPLAGMTTPQMTGFAAKVRQAIDDYLFFTDPRTAFSLSASGWQPLGPQQLGGPVAPEDTPVMQVSAKGRVLLRGAVRNRYTGHAWEDASAGRRYLLISPRFSSMRRDLFDTARPKDDSRLPAYETIHVRLFADAASTLYLTQRVRSPGGDGLVPYFSPATEVFATRSLEAGDLYSFSGRRMTGATQGVRSAVLAAQEQEDAWYETVRSEYLALPDGIDERVYRLASELTQGAQTDYDRAAALCGHLQRAFPYTLDQSIPPADADFVSWFLLEEQKGYCTSFATSLAVMARMVGLPARYVEGYAAEPDGDGIARVTNEHAHAWVEIYFKGFGWLSFDPTPGYGGAERTPEENPESTQDGGGDDPTPTPPPDGEESPTPEPTPTPTPT
ncbi:MAG: transglutaminase domain-containing protein, partial [Clostridia bacterium]|nr:transglutaminase domain-containing protein [Clostridia bacterium]